MTLADRFFAWRIGTLAKPSFQRWAARFPLTRPLANRRADALFRLVTGFVYSQIILACVRLDLFALLRPGPMTIAALAPRLGLDEPAVERLLAAAAALRLVERRGPDRYGLGSHGAVILGNPGITAMIRHHAVLYRDLEDPVALLREETRPTRLQAFWAYARNPDARSTDAGAVGDYSALMAASQAFIAEEVLDTYRFKRHRKLLDLGGGEGAFIDAVLHRAPKLEATLFDLPAVAERAREGLRHDPRVTIQGGDFFTDPLPEGADLLTLVRIVHDHDDAAAKALIGRAYEALAPGGVVLLAEPMAATTGAEAMGDAYFGMYLLAMGSGRPRRREILEEMLRDAGFLDVRQRPGARPMLVRVLTGKKPENPHEV